MFYIQRIQIYFNFIHYFSFINLGVLLLTSSVKFQNQIFTKYGVIRKSKSKVFLNFLYSQ